MSRTRRPQLQWRLQWLNRAARRERSLSQRPDLNLSRQLRHRRRANRDHDRRVVAAAAEVVAEVVPGRERLRQDPQSLQNIPPWEHPQQEHPR